MKIYASLKITYVRRDPHRLQQHKQVKLDDIGMNNILKSYLISPKDLRNNDFQNFYQARKQALLSLIETAMGKKIALGNLDQEAEDVDEIDEN